MTTQDEDLKNVKLKIYFLVMVAVWLFLVVNIGGINGTR
jgi:hypothetical protein